MVDGIPHSGAPDHGSGPGHGESGGVKPDGGNAVGDARMRRAEGLATSLEAPDPYDPQFENQPVFAMGPDGQHVWWGTAPGTDASADRTDAVAPVDPPGPVTAGSRAGIDNLTPRPDDAGDGFGQPLFLEEKLGPAGR